MALLRARHEEGKDHGRRKVLLDVAERTGLDLVRFEEDLSDRALLPLIGDDYHQGHDVVGVFGTPTFVFGNGAAAYLKLQQPPPPEEAMAVFEDFVRLGRDRPFVLEVKRPSRPT